MRTNKHTILVALFYNLNFFIYNFVNSLFRYNEYMYMQELMNLRTYDLAKMWRYQKGDN